MLCVFPNTKDINSIISDLLNKFNGLNSSEIVDKYGNELKDELKQLKDKIKTFMENNDEIKKMKAKAEEIKATFGEVDTSELEEDFKKYIESLKNLSNSIKEFNDPINKKLKELFYPIVDQIKKAGGQPILDILAQLPNLPKNITEQIKQMQEGESIMKKITDLLDDIDSQIYEKLTKLFNDLKEKLESVLNGTLEEQLEDFKQKMNSSELINALKEHFSSLKELLGPLKELELGDNNKIEKAVNDIIDKIKNLNIEDIKANLKKGVDKMENIFNIEDNIAKIKETFENKDIKEVLKEQKDEILKKFSELKKKIEAEDGSFIKAVENKLKLIESVLDEAGVITAFNEHIDALKNLTFDLEDKENFEKYKESFEGIKNALNKVNSEELIAALNSTLFEIKDDFIEQINTLPKLQKIIENLEELIPSEKIKNAPEFIVNSFNNIFEKIKPELDKLKKNEKLAPIFKNLEEIKNKIEEELKKAGISEKIDEYVEQLKQLKEKLNVENIKEIILNELSTCDNQFIEKLDNFGEIESMINKISDDFEKSEIKNVIIGLHNDSQKAKEEIEAELEKIKSKIVEIKVKIEEKIKPYQNDPRFEPLVKIIGRFSEALDKLKEQLEKLKENEQYKALKGKIDNIKKEIVKIEENIKDIELKDIYYKLKDKIKDLDINGKLTKLNEEKDKFLEEWKKYKELDPENRLYN